MSLWKKLQIFASNLSKSEDDVKVNVTRNFKGKTFWWPPKWNRKCFIHFFSKFPCFAPRIQDSPILNFRDLTKFKVEINGRFDPTRQLNCNKIPWPESFICSGFNFSLGILPVGLAWQFVKAILDRGVKNHHWNNVW